MNETPITVETVRSAQERISAILFPTPLTRSLTLSEDLGRSVYLKWENKFRTGSFKERGAVNFLSLLPEDKRAAGVCAASAGNHALAVSYHARRMEIPCEIVMPTTAPLVKIQQTRAHGANVLLEGSSFHEAYNVAQELAIARGLTFLPAFDHPWTIAGQGTCALEILEVLPEVDAVCIPVGGGGLAAGIATVMSAERPECYLLGVRSEWAAVHRAGTEHHTPLADVSLADGIAVKNPGAITEPLLRSLLDHEVTISETTIAHAVVELLVRERAVVEGAGAAGLAALLQGNIPDTCRNVVVVLSGSNIDINVLSRLITWDLGEQGRLLRMVVSVPDRPGSLSFLTATIARLGANILEVAHDRSFASSPGDVEIRFLLEVRNHEHKDQIVNGLRMEQIAVAEVPLLVRQPL